MLQQIIDFWFSDATRKLWFKSTPEFDQELYERYQDTWERARRGELDHWMQTAEGCLALVIILDQFPLNMFRGSAQGFASEAQSRDVAAVAIEQGFDKALSNPTCALPTITMPSSKSMDAFHTVTPH
jgi:uncharacterized protein (DUF924 family)